MAGAAGAAGVADLPPKILNITVPQTGHLPLMALRPFFIVSSTPSAISRLALHLTQYPSAINFLLPNASCAGQRRKPNGSHPPKQLGKGRLSKSVKNQSLVTDAAKFWPLKKRNCDQNNHHE